MINIADRRTVTDRQTENYSNTARYAHSASRGYKSEVSNSCYSVHSGKQNKIVISFSSTIEILIVVINKKSLEILLQDFFANINQEHDFCLKTKTIFVLEASIDGHIIIGT